jgi:hypothetical protein
MLPTFPLTGRSGAVPIMPTLRPSAHWSAAEARIAAWTAITNRVRDALIPPTSRKLTSST